MYYNENTVLYLNGKFESAAQAKTDLFGQTLHYGYGVFEGIRAYSTSKGVKIFKNLEHYQRLKRSAELIGIPVDFNVEELCEASYKVLEMNNLKDAYLRPIVFCDPNMSLTKPTGVNVMISAWEWGAYLGDKLLRLKLSSFCRPHNRSAKIEAKACGHYINSILATNEAKQAGYDEGLLLDTDGYLAEGPGANLFFEKNGELYTPQLGNILPGITRATVLELAQELGIKVHQGQYKLEQLLDADAVFLCGTAAEVIGVQSLDLTQFPMPWEQSLGKKIRTAYLNLVTC